MDRYEIIPEDKRSAFAGPQHATQNPSVRREHKIAQYKIEKETKGKLEVRCPLLPGSSQTPANLPRRSKELRKRRQDRRPRAQASTSTATTLTAPPEELDDLAYDSDSEDDYSRDLHITLLQLHYLRAHAELASMDQELELLVHGMKMSELPSGRADDARGREEGREDEDEGSWRVERLESKEGPLLDPKGKVCHSLLSLPTSADPCPVGPSTIHHPPLDVLLPPKHPPPPPIRSLPSLPPSPNHDNRRIPRRRTRSRQHPARWWTERFGSGGAGESEREGGEGGG